MPNHLVDVNKKSDYFTYCILKIEVKSKMILEYGGKVVLNCNFFTIKTDFYWISVLQSTKVGY